MTPDLQKTLTRTSAVLALVTALALPGGYFVAGRNALDHEGTARAEAVVQALMQEAKPETWASGPDSARRLANILRLYVGHGHWETTLLFDRQGRLVAADDAKLPGPVVVSQTLLGTPEQAVGRVEVHHDLRGLLLETGGVALLGLLLGSTILVVLRTLPLRALRKGSAALSSEQSLRRDAQDSLQLALAELEQKVAERTASLEQALAERDAINEELMRHRQQLDQLVAEKTVRLQTILDTCPLGIVFSRGGYFVSANRALLSLLGCREADLVGRPTSRLFASDTEFERYRMAAAPDLSQGRVHTGEYRFCLHGRQIWGELNSQAIDPAKPEAGVISIVDDITERHLAAASLQHRLAQEQLLSAVARDLAHTADENLDAAIQRALQTIGEFVDAQMGFVVLHDDPSSAACEAAPGVSHVWRQVADGSAIELPNPDTPPGLLARLQTLTTLRVDRPNDLPLEAEADRQWLAEFGVRALLRLPMADQSGLFGYLGFDKRTTDTPWLDEDMGLLQTLAGVLKSALTRRATFQRLDFSRSLLEAALESTEDGLLVVSESFEVTHFNQRFLKIWNLPTTTHTGMHKDDLVRLALPLISQADAFLKQTHEIYRRNAATSLDVIELIDGRIIERYSRPQILAGRSVGRVWSFRDITEQRRAEQAIRRLNEDLEERVNRRTIELQASYKEMESFSHSISHDLRTPLRGINGFAHLLAEEYGPQLDVTARDYLRRITSATVRMGTLIDDLLHLAQLSRVRLNVQELDLSALAHQIVAELGWGVQPSQFMIQEDLRCRGDGILLKAALGHLLENAWKFSCQQEVPLIEFGSLPGATPVFFVRDNGVGFDMSHATKLFQPFQQLQNADAIQGTGIGLATVRRILDRHQGRIWANSAPGRGATFFFTVAPLAVSEEPAPAPDH